MEKPSGTHGNLNGIDAHLLAGKPQRNIDGTGKQYCLTEGKWVTPSMFDHSKWVKHLPYLIIPSG